MEEVCGGYAWLVEGAYAIAQGKPGELQPKNGANVANWLGYYRDRAEAGEKWAMHRALGHLLLPAVMSREDPGAFQQMTIAARQITRLCEGEGYLNDSFHHAEVVVDVLCAGHNLASGYKGGPLANSYGRC